MVDTRYEDVQYTDFSGGITDKYIDGAPNEHPEIDNFIVNEIKKPVTRNGYSVAYDQETLQRIMGLFNLNGTILAFRGTEMWEYDDVSALTVVPTPNANPFFQVTGTSVYPSADEWRNQLLVTNRGELSPLDLNYPMVVYRNNLNALTSHEIGLPDYPEGNLLFAPATTAGGTFTYLYALHYSYEYQVGTVTHRTVSRTYSVLYETNTAIDTGAANDVELSFFDQILPTANQMDVANIKIEIYRTKDGGTTFYKLGEVANGFAGVFTDDNKDDGLEANEVIYTSGGIVNHSKPPKCRFAFTINDKAYFCSVIEELASGDRFRPYRVVQSIPGNITGVFDSAFIDVDEDITGGASANGLPIIFTKSYIYRIEGQVDSEGNGVLRARVISDTIGCVSNNSIVNVGKQLYFAGNDGFYVTDGYRIDMLTPRLVDSYDEITENSTRAAKIYGTYDEENELIYWSVGDNDSENNKWWIFNLKIGGFTTASGKAFFSSATTQRDSSIYRGDEQGYIYDHNPAEFNDLIRDTSIAASLWETTHIPFALETNATDFQSTVFRKIVSNATITTKTATPAAYMPISINDDRDKIGDMQPVRLLSTDLWDVVNFIWDDPAILWKTAKTTSKQRHFPRSHSRCTRKQVRIEPAIVILYKSDTYDTADVALVDPLDPLTFTVTLAVGTKWPTDIVNDSISFEDDNYLNTYNINSRTDQTITCSGGGLTPGLAKKWQINGYKRQQRIEIKAIAMTYTTLSREGSRFQKEEEGGNT